MKRILIVITSIVTLCIFLVAFGSKKNVYAADVEETTPTTSETTESSESETTESSSEDKEVFPCRVISNIGDGGSALFDIEEGNVGDKVTVLIKADFLFNVESVQINGTSIALSSDGKYQFELIEGENVVSATFAISDEKLTKIADLINGVEKDGVTSIFTVSNLLTFVSWGISVLLSSGFFLTLIKNKKLKSKTTDEITSIVTNTLETKNAEILNDFINKLIGPSLETITEKMDGMDECIKVFCRCFVLSQDDTPENRLAIINELTNLSNSDAALTEQIRSIIKEEQAAQEEKIKERDKAIEELKESNAKLTEQTTESSEDHYGQL